MLLAIDPGANSGWATFFDDMLLECGLASKQMPPTNLDHHDTVAIERPVIYPGGRTKSPNDILSVSLSAGEWGGRYRHAGSTIVYIEPREWKGTLDPDVCQKRVLGRLEGHERMVVDDIFRMRKIGKSVQHNVIDAIGIGLFVLGRFGK